MSKFVCTKCGIEKELHLFPKASNKRGHATKCKECYKKYNQAYKQGDKGRAIRLKCLYGVTLEQVQELYYLQEGKCAICGTPKPPQGYEGLHVDHDHTTNKVRGLLCGDCNMMLGLARDRVKTLQNAINYLNKATNETNRLQSDI